MEHGPKGDYSPKVFEVIVDLLSEPEKAFPAQSEHLGIVKEDNNHMTLSDFFSFRFLISTRLISVFYFLGAIAITIVSWIFFMKDLLLIGIISIIVGNLLWRLTCEMAIVFFRMNEQLAQLSLIHQELKRSTNNSH